MIRTIALSSFLIASTSLFAGSGSLDPSFGTGGKVVTDFDGGSDHGLSMAVQADGKIVVVGFSNTSPTSSAGRDFAIARYNIDGTLDTTFGTAGTGKVTTDFSASIDDAMAVAIQADGKIVVAGASNGDFALARYNISGTLDTTFGTGGKVTTDFSGLDHANAVAIQADGKIIAAGQGFNSSSGPDFALARYLSDGTLDTTFGSGGKVTTAFSNDPDEAFAIAIQTDGKIVVAGTSNASAATQFDFALARYNGDGTLDTTFGSGGKVTTDFEGGCFCIRADDLAFAVSIQPDGKIVAAGRSDTNNFDFALARYNTNGALDTTFGSGGRVTTDFSLGSTDFAQAVVIQGDGRIVAAGTSNGDFALVRYNSNGTLDTGFGSGGKVSTDFSGGFDQANAVALQVDGKIIAAGFAGDDFALARYIGVTPQDLATALGDQVQTLLSAGSINPGQANSLTAKLQQIVNALNQGKTHAACNQLNAFINEVTSLIGNGVLTSAEGQPLIDAAVNIERLLGC